MQRLDHDEIHCPLSLDPMRHPIRLSSGRYCELEYLVRVIQANGAICPVTRKKIEYAVYDNEHKEKLDRLLKDDPTRYPEYAKAELLKQLDATLNPCKQAAYSSFYVGSISALGVYYVLSNNLINTETVSEHTKLSLGVFLTMTIALGEFATKVMSRNQFGLFSGIQRVATQLNVVANHLNVQPNEALNAATNTMLLNN